MILSGIARRIFLVSHIHYTCFSNRSCQCWWSWDLLWYHNPWKVHWCGYAVTPDMCNCVALQRYYAHF